MPDLSTAVDIGVLEEHGLTVQYRPSVIWRGRFDARGETELLPKAWTGFGVT